MSSTGVEETSFTALFENASIRVARCNREGLISEMNPAFEGMVSSLGFRWLKEAASPADRDQIDSFLKNIFDAGHATARISLNGSSPNEGPTKWIGWLESGIQQPLGTAMVFVEQAASGRNAQSGWLQAERWEAIGRLTGGIVHDFNNLLTGVMLYSDLMLSSLDLRDCRRRYAEEIRSAIVQASGLVQQLLVFARPQASPSGPLNFNDVAEGMCDLLKRLIGEDIVLDLRLDRELGEVEIARSQAQQVLLNLVLNARDALQPGGCITIETSNCSFQPVGGVPTQTSAASFPCILLAVSDNGCGMTAETRRRLFEPFFTTKAGASAGGLGLTTVHAIVTTNRGLIHFESEPGHGTRALMLFPRNIQSGSAVFSEHSPRTLQTSANPLQALEKECAL
jgi:two-component system, cell cycle sensor histidine kinase and response regulator CckA